VKPVRLASLVEQFSLDLKTTSPREEDRTIELSLGIDQNASYHSLIDFERAVGRYEFIRLWSDVYQHTRDSGLDTLLGLFDAHASERLARVARRSTPIRRLVEKR
jgi:hypothetical protein